MNNSTSINYSDLASCPYPVAIFLTTTLAVITSAAVIYNVLVIVTVYKTPSLWASTNYYYVNMAVSEFLSGLATWPSYLTDEVITSSGSPSLLQGAMATAGCKVGVYVKIVSLFVSILSLVLIAVDRFIATVFPLKATLTTRKTRVALLLATWSISTALCFPFFFYSELKQFGQKTFCAFSMNGLAMKIYVISCIFVLFLAPLSAIVFLYSRIMRALKKRVKPGSDTKGGECQQKRNKQIEHIMKIFKWIVVAFVVSFFLLIIFVALISAFPGFSREDMCSLLVGFGYYVFPLFGTAINPLILFKFSSTFRDALQTLCLPFSDQCCICSRCTM